MESTIVYWGYIEIVEKKMDYYSMSCYIGIMENKREASQREPRTAQRPPLAMATFTHRIGHFNLENQVWSDDCDGDGHNWLGLQLMILRENLKMKRLVVCKHLVRIV